jgi:nucleotide-binding universal stress UspA family protein
MVRFPGSVVVGVDGSPESAWAARVGEQMAGRAGTECHLLHAIPHPWANAVARSGRDSAGVWMRGPELTGAVRATTLERLIIRPGHPGAVLDQVAIELGADLIVVGGKQRTALQRVAVDSTTTGLIRTTVLPVLVAVRDMDPGGRVLAAVDLSVAAAAPTIATAERAAAFFGAELRVLSVLEPLMMVPEVPSYDLTGYYAMLEDHLKQDIWPLVHDARASKITRQGVPAWAIIREAEEWGARLVVVGSQGKDWMDRLLIGSVTEHLINHLHAPILVQPVRAALSAAAKQPSSVTIHASA